MGYWLWGSTRFSLTAVGPGRSSEQMDDAWGSSPTVLSWSQSSGGGLSKQPSTDSPLTPVGLHLPALRVYTLGVGYTSFSKWWVFWTGTADTQNTCSFCHDPAREFCLKCRGRHKKPAQERSPSLWTQSWLCGIHGGISGVVAWQTSWDIRDGLPVGPSSVGFSSLPILRRDIVTCGFFPCCCYCSLAYALRTSSVYLIR